MKKPYRNIWLILNMHNFEQIYLHMLFEQKGILQFDLEQFKKFLNTGTKFKDGKIISQSKNDLLIDITPEFFNYCYDHQNEYLQFNKIKELMKKSRHYRNIKNAKNFKLYFSIFNFNNQLEVKSFIFQCLNFKEDNKQFLDAINEFNKNCKSLDGFVGSYKDTTVCLVNASHPGLQTTIYHQLSHLIQYVGNVHIIKDFKFDDSIKNNKRFSDLRKLGITINDLNYYFSTTEYATHVDDLIIGLWKTFLKFYVNKFDVIHKFFIELNTALIQSEDFSKSSFLQNYALANDNEISPLIMYAASFYFNHKYQKIKNSVQNALINKFNNLKK